MSEPHASALQVLRGRIVSRLPADSAGGRRARKAAAAANAFSHALTMPFASSLDALAFRHAWALPAPGIGKQARGMTVVMLVVAPIREDSRVQRSAAALVHAGYQVIVIWPEMPSTAGTPIDWGPNITFTPLPPSARRFADRYPGVLGRAMLRAALAHQPFAFHAHDLTTAVIALTAARRTGAHAVVDFHEWLSESVRQSPLTGQYTPISALTRRTRKSLERHVLHHASAVITVTPSIAAAMERDAECASPRVHVVRNIPEIARSNPNAYPALRTSLQIPDDHLVVLYQGGLGATRNLEAIISALRVAPKVHLVIRGPNADHAADGYRRIARSIGVADRLHLLPPVPATDVVDAALSADAGLFTVANLCRSFVHAMPNKIFEYLAAGLPVLTIDNPDVRDLVAGYGVGLTFDADRPDSIAAALRAMADAATRQAMRARIPACLASLDAASEWQRLADIYRDLASGQPLATPHGRAIQPANREA